MFFDSLLKGKAMTTRAILEKFELKAENMGTSSGVGDWLKTSGPMIESINPTTGEPLGKVQSSDASAYSQVVETAQDAFKSWRMVPAPKRGDVVRECRR
jgi:aldehyde dehydrogenase (NAD+)